MCVSATNNCHHNRTWKIPQPRITKGWVCKAESKSAHRSLNFQTFSMPLKYQLAKMQLKWWSHITHCFENKAILRDSLNIQYIIRVEQHELTLKNRVQNKCEMKTTCWCDFKHLLGWWNYWKLQLLIIFILSIDHWSIKCKKIAQNQNICDSEVIWIRWVIC